MSGAGWPRVAFLAVAGLIAIGFVASSDVQAQATGRIDGQVVNGSSGAGPVANLSVIVHILRDRAKVGELLVQTDQAGSFVVDGLEPGPALVYFPVVEYGGATYFPERPITLDDASQKSVQIRVFEPTDSDEAIAFERSNLLVLRVAPAALTIMEMGAVTNRSDRTYVGQGSSAGGAPSPTLRFGLPKGATQVTPQAGLSPNDLTVLGDGFAATAPVQPGRHEIAFSYELPYDSATFDLVKRQEHPTAVFNLYVPDTGLTVVSPQLTFQGVSEFGGQRYQLYSAQSLSGGDRLSIRLAGLPAPGGLRPLELGLIVLVASGVALAGSALIAIRRRSAAPGSAVGESPAADQAADPAPDLGPDLAPVLAEERLRLVRSLAELDERHSAGAIDPNRYRSERQQAKARLLELLDGRAAVSRQPSAVDT